MKLLGATLGLIKSQKTLKSHSCGQKSIISIYSNFILKNALKFDNFVTDNEKNLEKRSKLWTINILSDSKIKIYNFLD